MNLTQMPTKSKLIIVLVAIVLVLIGLRLFSSGQTPLVQPLIPGITPQPTQQPLIRRFIPAPLLPATPKPTVITAVDPQPNETKVGTFRPIKLTFDQKVEPSSIALITSPLITLALPVATDEATFVFNHSQPFQSETLYQVQVLVQNQPAFSWSFTTAETQYDPGLFQDIDRYHQENYPLINFVPYQTETIVVNYLGPKKIVVKLIRGTKAAAEAELSAWMRSRHVEPASHQLVWE